MDRPQIKRESKSEARGARWERVDSITPPRAAPAAQRVDGKPVRQAPNARAPSSEDANEAFTKRPAKVYDNSNRDNQHNPSRTLQNLSFEPTASQLLNEDAKAILDRAPESRSPLFFPNR